MITFLKFMPNTKILITGANGQLGSEIKKISGQYKNIEFIFTDFPELDISNENAVNLFFDKNKPAYLINCAAYTAVDNAENDFENADKINNISVGILAETAAKNNCKFIHFSTDYVYSGSKAELPYTENDTTQPQTVYGKTKLAGENTLINSEAEHIIIRTSWLYSEFGNNFVKTMLRLGSERSELKVIFDQIGTPTYAGDLALVTMKIVQNSISENKNFIQGVYLYSNEGVCSWYDFAHEIMEISQTNCKIIPIESKEYPQKAIRPHFSVLNKKKIKQNFDLQIPHWRTSLKICISALK